MVDLKGQYMAIREEIDGALRDVLDSGRFIGGPAVQEFASSLAAYNGSSHAVTCANGTDALQIALMALGLRPGDEVIVPDFTYVASAEVIALLSLKPVFVDVDARTFNIDVAEVRKAITERTRAVIPVHLYGQCCDMEALMEIASEYGLYVVEDNAQSIGSDYRFRDGTVRKSGSIGHIGCTSFFPSKNLGCYGDGGALFTDDPELAERISMIANHGQRIKYHHDIIGCNSRLDSIQAAVLNVKLRYLDRYCRLRREAAFYYNEGFSDLPQVTLPYRADYSSHVYHQYTVQVPAEYRDSLKKYLESRGIPSMIYYPLPLHGQKAFKGIARLSGSLETAGRLAASVLSLPMHTELTRDVQDEVIYAVKEFFRTNG